MEKDINIESLEKYLKGNGTEPDFSELKKWFSDTRNEERIRIYSYKFWKEYKSETQYTERLASLLDKIHHRIRKEEYTVIRRRSRRQSITGYLLRAAAVLFLPLLALTVLNWDIIFSTNKNKRLTAELYAPKGARIEFSLPDGSTGWLNGGSTISFPSTFKGRNRLISLKGEAFFNVISDHKRPFIVQTSNIMVKAYGTAFNVLDYDDVSNAEVTLVSGEVEVFRENEQGKLQSLKKMEPNTHCLINFVDNNVETSHIGTADYTSWKEGKLVFRNDPMQTVIKKLERWYNVDIEIRDQELFSHKYHATFEDESFEEVLRLISLTTPMKYEIRSRQRNSDYEYPRKKAIIFLKDKP